jgi:DNA-binding Xre family transcriptional regulator
MSQDYGIARISQLTLTKLSIYHKELYARYALSDEQVNVLHAVGEGKNIFFTGSAGEESNSL